MSREVADRELGIRAWLVGHMRDAHLDGIEWAAAIFLILCLLPILALAVWGLIAALIYIGWPALVFEVVFFAILWWVVGMIREALR